MQYKIYIPGESTFQDAHLHERGLGDLCRDGGPDWEQVARGPDDKAGMVAQWRTGKVGVDAPDGCPKDWEWVAVPPDKSWWLGVNPAAPPSAADLARKNQLRGVPITLADGRQWSIPIAMGMPYRIGVDYETGEETGVVDQRYTQYYQRAFRHGSLLAERQEELAALNQVFFCVKLTDDEMRELYTENMMKWAGISTLPEMEQKLAISIVFDESLDHAVDALAINYRLTRFMILHFQLLEVSEDTNHLRDICLGAIDAAAIVETLKKKEVVRQTSLLAG